MTALAVALLLLGLPVSPDTLVRTATEFHEAVRLARPGDTIVMANGIWQDVLLVLDAEGAEGDSITVRAESPGHVILTGTSRLRIGGQYLKVEGLWFHRGALAGGHVIQFRTERPARHSRLTNCAVTEYNPDNWLIQYKWVSMYGTHNRVDHCYFAGKTHDGATLVVWLEDPPDDRPNYHRIDHNHFGWRPVLGKNGGETIRIGTSSRSMQDSFTLVEFNLFHRTNGEHEIISNKSGHNTFRYNTFREAQGALTLRHGNHAVIAQNYFLGGGQPGTGGVRVIGEDHEVSHNYFANLGGDSSRASLSIMSGIPNSPLNRYFQVKRPVIAHNTFVDTRTTILYGLGADEEKTLLPESVLFTDNVVVTTSDRPVVTAQVSTENVSWSGNMFHGSSLGIAPQSGILWEKADMALGTHQVQVPTAAEKGARMDYPPLTGADAGPSWWGQPWTPTILADTANALPEFSYAGYNWGERPMPEYPVTFSVTDFGATGQDMNDDTRAFQAALDAAHTWTGPVVVGIPSGVYHISGVLMLERDRIILRGSGTGATTIYIEKPLGAMDIPAQFVPSSDSVLVRGRPVSPFTQIGGVIWSRSPDAVHSVAIHSLAGDGRVIRISDADRMPVPSEALIVSGQDVLLHVSVVSSAGDEVYTKQSLPDGLTGSPEMRLQSLNQLSGVGIEHLTVEFERVPYGGHQHEDGYNAIYLSQVQHSWIRNVNIINSDAGIILDRSAQVTVENVTITGRPRHIGLQLIDSWHTLAQNVQVQSHVIHPVGIQGASGYNVFHISSASHVFDITSNYPNLYDHLMMMPPDDSRSLWTTDTGTAMVLWNTKIAFQMGETMRLPTYAGELGPETITIGLSSSVPIRLQPLPGAMIDGVNRPGLTVLSLYKLQLQQRLNREK